MGTLAYFLHRVGSVLLLLFVIILIVITSLHHDKTFSTIPVAQEITLDNTYTPPIHEVLPTLDFSSKQQEVILFAYHKGEPLGLGYTLAAIAIQESCAGRTPINVDDPAFGIFHNLLSSVIDRENLSPTLANRNMIATRLLFNRDYAANQAIAELLYWSNRYKGKHLQWSKMVMSYNAGTKYTNGANYLRAIKKHIKLLKGQ